MCVAASVAQVEARERAYPVKKCPSYFSDDKVPQDGGFGATEMYLASAAVLCVVLGEVYVKLPEWTASGDKRALYFASTAPSEYW